MVVTGRIFGHEVEWVYRDTKEPVTNDRPCPDCGQLPTFDGYDPCWGHIPGVKSACCGHGEEPPYIEFEDGTIIRGVGCFHYIGHMKGRRALHEIMFGMRY